MLGAGQAQEKQLTEQVQRLSKEASIGYFFFFGKIWARRACVKYVSFVIWLRGLCRGSGATWGAEYVEQAPGLHGIVDGSEEIMLTSRQ